MLRDILLTFPLVLIFSDFGWKMHQYTKIDVYSISQLVFGGGMSSQINQLERMLRIPVPAAGSWLILQVPMVQDVIFVSKIN